MSAHSRMFATSDAQRRLTKINAQRQVIEPARLASLAGNPKMKSGSIARQFGYGRATFFLYLSQHPELWRVYAEARLSAGFKVTRAHLLHQRGPLSDDDHKIIEAIAGGARTLTVIESAAKVDPRVFAARIYNLENELHEIFSEQVGLVTHYFLRGEESTTEGTEEGRNPTVREGAQLRKGKAA